MNALNLAMLAAESQRVIALRLWKLSWGGSAATAEVCQMVSEKMAECVHATSRVMAGASLDSVVADYRAVVQANIRRLSV